MLWPWPRATSSSPPVEKSKPDSLVLECRWFWSNQHRWLVYILPYTPTFHSTGRPTQSCTFSFSSGPFSIAGSQMGLWHARHFTWLYSCLLTSWPSRARRAWTTSCWGTRRPSHCSRLWLHLRTFPQAIVPASGEEKEACSHKQVQTHSDWHTHTHTQMLTLINWIIRIETEKIALKTTKSKTYMFLSSTKNNRSTTSQRCFF